MRKRTKVGEGSGIGIIIHSKANVVEEVMPTLHNYFSTLTTLLVAYSKAGCKLRADAPASEPKTMEPTRAVERLLDILTRYVYLVQDRAHRLPCTSRRWSG